MDKLSKLEEIINKLLEKVIAVILSAVMAIIPNFVFNFYHRTRALIQINVARFITWVKLKVTQLLHALQLH